MSKMRSFETWTPAVLNISKPGRQETRHAAIIEVQKPSLATDKNTIQIGLFVYNSLVYNLFDVFENWKSTEN